MTRETVVAKLREARDIHAKIAEWQHNASEEERAAPMAYEEAVGDSTWHEEWVKVYDEALELLRKTPSIAGGGVLHLGSRHVQSSWFSELYAGELDAKGPDELDAKGPDA